jgi:serine-type D-Ala-D-Ala carboxypeptidase (penicillin-binding protein 5/6)
VISLVLVWTGAVGHAVAAPPQALREVTCASCLLLSDEGVIWSRAPDTARPNASTTKMMTALVVRDRADLDQEVRVPPSAVAVTGGRLSLEVGESLTVRELLFALLMVSSNHAAITLAEHVAGSERDFVDLVNEEASDLGATSFNAVTSHGLDAPGHVASASDLATIALRLLEDPLLAEIVSTPAASVTSDRRGIQLENTNELLESYRGLIGIKTGFTLRAGNVLVAAAERQGRRVVAVVMDSDDSFADTRVLLDHGFARLRRGVLVEGGDSVGTLVFDPYGSLNVVAARTVRGLPHRESIALDLEPSPTVEAPVVAGDSVGEVTVHVEGRVVARLDALAADTVEPAEPNAVQRLLTFTLRTAARLPGLG